MSMPHSVSVHTQQAVILDPSQDTSQPWIARNSTMGIQANRSLSNLSFNSNLSFKSNRITRYSLSCSINSTTTNTITRHRSTHQQQQQQLQQITYRSVDPRQSMRMQYSELLEMPSDTVGPSLELSTDIRIKSQKDEQDGFKTDTLYRSIY